MDKIILSLDLLRQRNFNYGQIYVALSRVTSFNGLYTGGVFSGKGIRADPRALQVYERMRLESDLWIEHVDDPQNQSFTVTLLNIRSINKHLLDFAYNERLRKSDLVCLTETQMMQRSQTEINSELKEFEIIHNTNANRFQSLASCLKDHIGIISHEKMVEASCTKFSRTTYFDSHIKLEKTCIKWNVL